MPRLPFIGLMALLILTPRSRAEEAKLTFESTLKEVTAEVEDRKFVVVFPFENKSGETIEIVSRDAPCSCLSAKVKDGKLRYAPGEKGEIEAIFMLGSFYGTRKRGRYKPKEFL